MTVLAESLRQARWRHPEWVAAAAAGAVWVVLLVLTASGAGHVAAPDHVHAGAGHHGAAGAAGTATAHPVEAGGAIAAVTSAAAVLAWWLVMAAAMMLPAVLPTVRNVALTGPWSRRQRNVALFLAAYLAVWAAMGLVAVPIGEWAPDALGLAEPALLAGVLVVAAAWELTRWKRRALRACHLVPPLPPHGRRADRACLAAGLQHGGRCVRACWALMAAMALAGHAHLAVMAVLTAVVTTQRVMRRGPELGRPVALALVLVAAAAAALG